MARRRSREPEFGSDSFLDVIANLVGIVIIIIVMVAARIREMPAAQAPEPAQAATVLPAAPDFGAVDAETQSLSDAIAELQARLVEALRRIEESASEGQRLRAEVDALTERRQAFERQLRVHEGQTSEQLQAVTQAEQAQGPLRERLAALDQAIVELERRPVDRRPLRFHLPVSRPVGEGELLFELRGGRVAFVDLQGLVDEVKKSFRAKADLLKTQWEATDSVGPIGPFRLEYVVARERATPLDNAFAGLPPANDGSFTYGVAGWEVVPVWKERGEAVAEAQADGSRFRQVVDDVNPDHAALTFFVYEDSFAAYRDLRDWLYERGFVVAGRPLEMDKRITGSRKGTVSRGQ